MLFVFLEERAVGLSPDLGEVDFRCRTGNKPETVSRALLSCCCYGNSRRRLEEVAGELIDWVAKSDNAPRHATPLHVERVDNRAYDVSQWVSGSQAIRNREGIEYGTDVPYMKFGGTRIQVTFGSALRDGSHPHGQSWRNSGIVGMQAQRACCR
jgi:hypothetical protein